FVTAAYDIFESVQAQYQSELISLACGLVPKHTIYTEKKTKIIYKSDANHIDSGLVGRVSHEYTEHFEQQTWTLRSFPEGTRNCYNFNLTANQKYLIRGTFFYGNYDGLNRFSSFDLHISPVFKMATAFCAKAQGALWRWLHRHGTLRRA
ncbi:unnamed protein product, partial [Brassica oleracea]